MSYTISRTETSYGTIVERFVNTNGNFPIINRKYIPSEGSKFKKLGFEQITKVKIPGRDSFYSVINNGKRENYAIDELRKLFKDLKIQDVKGHRTKEFIDGLKQIAKRFIR